MARPRRRAHEPLIDDSSVVATPAFRSWFGDSKVRGPSGAPLIVYHGSSDVRGLFLPDERGYSGFRPTARRGSAYFATDSYPVAATYADGHRAFDYQAAEPAVVPLYLSIQDPLVVHAGGARWRDTAGAIQTALNGGHDGIIIHDSVDPYTYLEASKAERKPSTVYAWFQPWQAKSALRHPLRSSIDGAELPYTGPNRGTFSRAPGLMD